MWTRTQFGTILAAVAAGMGMFAGAALPPDGGTRAERFANPPGACRLLPIRHNYPFDVKNNERQLAAMLDRGYGGFAGNVAFGSIQTNGTWKGVWKGYVDEEPFWPQFIHAVNFAKAANMSLWLYDECGYPSGTARDLTLKGHPELENTGYLIAVTTAEGGATATVKMPPGAFRRAVAWPLAADGTLAQVGCLDLADAVARGVRTPPPPPFASARVRPYDAEGRPEAGFEGWRTNSPVASFTWNVPPGKWKIFAVTEDWTYEGTHAECKGMKVKFRYPNPLRKDAIARYLEVNHEQYVRHLGNDLGRYFVSTFTDEPSIMSNWWRPMPYLTRPSAPGRAEAYRKRTGRDLLDDIPLISADGANSADCRIAFWDIAGQMTADAFFGTISDWCRAHGFLSGGHLMGEETFNFHVSHYGDFFRCMRRLDAPSIDCLTSIPSNVSWLAALYAGSARELNGARYTMSETSDHCERNRKTVYQVCEGEVNGTLNRLLWGGINTFTSYYSFRGFKDDALRRINVRLGRLNTLLLTDGASMAEIAVLYPAADMQAAYVPGPLVWNDKGTAIRALENRFMAGVRSLYEAGRCYMIVDADALAAARIEGGELVHGKLRWKVVALPASTRLDPAIRAKLDAFRRAGGHVVDAGDEAALATRVGQILPPAMSVVGNGPHPLRVAHRMTSEGEVYFVMNDSAAPWTGKVALRNPASNIMSWDPEKDRASPVARNADGSIDLSFAPWSAIILSL